MNDGDIQAEIENPQPSPVTGQKQSVAINESDFEDWFALDDTFAPSSTSKKTSTAPDEEELDFREHDTNAIIDDEMDALFAHIDEMMSDAIPRPPLPTEDDFEDMYN